MTIGLGDNVKDIYTGFEVRDSVTVDGARIELVKSQPVLVAEQSTTLKTGGPRPDPQRIR